MHRLWQVTKDGEVKMVTIMLIGDPESCAKARAMIEEAVDNKEQKAKQRHKEYEKKKDAKVCGEFHYWWTLDLAPI